MTTLVEVDDTQVDGIAAAFVDIYGNNESPPTNNQEFIANCLQNHNKEVMAASFAKSLAAQNQLAVSDYRSSVNNLSAPVSVSGAGTIVKGV